MLGITSQSPGGKAVGPAFGRWYTIHPKNYEPPGYGVERPKSRFPMPPVNPGPNVMGIDDWGWKKMAMVGLGAYLVYKVL